MNRIRTLAVGFICLSVSGCINFGSSTPREFYDADANDVAAANLKQGVVHDYLAQVKLARPEIVREVWATLARGKIYRKHHLDQRNRWCRTTAWVDRRHTLHIVTTRDEDCPVCKGTGKRKWNNATMQNLGFDTRCVAKGCKNGIVEGVTTPYQWKLSAGDYTDSEKAASTMKAEAYRNAPPDSERYVAMLSSKNPEERLEACRWLDQNYVHIGQIFHEIEPMLKKARKRDQNSKLMVWQFWAGRDVPGQSARAYYRIYVSAKTGRVTQKGFYPRR